MDAMEHTSGANRGDENAFAYEISDEALEAAGLQCRANPPTQPFAIICIPFGPKSAAD
jgi:hypothetical protein